MDLLRIAFKLAPKETNKIIKKINIYDKQISALLKNLED